MSVDEREWARAEKALEDPLKQEWDNTGTPRGVSYRDYLKDGNNPKSFLSMVRLLGDNAVTHPSLAFLFDFVGFPFEVSRTQKRDTAKIGVVTLKVVNL